MLNKTILEKLATKYQTNYKNISREYIQNLFLRSFYTKDGSENFLFKGGTALRIAFKSPRFSEDLDFSGYGNGSAYEKVLESVLYDFASEGIGIDIEESKATSGGFLANIVINFEGEKIIIKNQISFRDKASKKFENIMISSDFVPSYNIFLLDRKVMVNEKIQALLTRAKPRDFYDLYFLIRSNLLTADQKNLLSQAKLKVLDSKLDFNKDLKTFLPISHWPIIKDLKKNLTFEIERFNSAL